MTKYYLNNLSNETLTISLTATRVIEPYTSLPLNDKDVEIYEKLKLARKGMASTLDSLHLSTIPVEEDSRYGKNAEKPVEGKTMDELEAEARAKADAEAAAKAEAEAKAKAEAEERAKAEEAARIQAEADAKLKEEIRKEIEKQAKKDKRDFAEGQLEQEVEEEFAKRKAEGQN